MLSQTASFVLDRVRYRAVSCDIWNTLAGARKCTVALRQNAIICGWATVCPVTNGRWDTDHPRFSRQVKPIEQ